MISKSLDNLKSQIERAEQFHGIEGPLARLLSGHSQTILGHLLPTRPLPTFESEQVSLLTPDGDTLVGFLSRPTSRKEIGLLHLFHGLAGSSDSFYMPRAGHAALEAGFAVVLWNHRGCGAGRKRALEPYHSGRSDDLGRAVYWGRDLMSTAGPEYRHGVLGYSLSANATCLLAARVVPSIDSNPLTEKVFENNLRASLPDFAIAVNPPFDLQRASERLSHGPSRIYGQHFMPALLESLEDRTQWSPENRERETFKNLAVRARKKISVFANVGTFDAAYTGPAGGFRDHLDYYARASCGPYLEKALVPLVILSADDDPITHGFSDLDPATLEKLKKPFVLPLVLVDAQKQGGHMGYVDRSTLLSPWKKEPRWLEKRIQMYLHSFGDLT